MVLDPPMLVQLAGRGSAAARALTAGAAGDAYFAFVVRLATFAALGPSGRVDDRRLEGILAGHALADFGVLGMDLPALRLPGRSKRQPLAELLVRLQRVEIPADDVDLFGALYQELVAPRDRHAAGEYYTPPWLARRIVAAAARDGDTVFDPACGSGAFVRVAAARGLSAIGADLNPLAVLAARANVALCRPADFAARPSVPPVTCQDSLVAPPPPATVAVGNPPWVALRFLPRERRARVLELADAWGLPGGRLRTHVELAAVFALHAVRAFGRAALILPRSFLGASQYESLRCGPGALPLRRLWDLAALELFPLPSVVTFFGPRRPATAIRGRVLTARDRPGARASFELARLGSLTSYRASRPGTPRLRAGPASPYRERFRQGATLVPRSYYFVEVRGRSHAGAVRVVTDPVAAQNAKPPYRGETMSGQIEADFLGHAVLSRHLVPFAVLEPALVVVPLDPTNDRRALMDPPALRAAGFPKMARWMDEVFRRFERHNRRSSVRCPLDRLDYHGELTAQPRRLGHVVVFNASGTHLSAAALAPRPTPPLIDAKCYWARVSSRAEADYLTGVLNAEVTGVAVKPFQSVGLQGERDLHKKALELPIPTYDGAQALHRRIAGNARRCAALAAGLVGPVAPASPGQLGRARAKVRAGLGPARAALEAAVRELLTC